MRKRKTIQSKKGAAKSATFAPKFFNHASNPLGDEVENEMMGKEEISQCKVDRFWGLDKDQHDRQLEKSRMEKEEIISIGNELEFRKVIVHHSWERDWSERDRLKAIRRQEIRDVEREHYMRTLNEGLESTPDIIEFIFGRASKSSKAATSQPPTTKSPLMPIPNEGTKQLQYYVKVKDPVIQGQVVDHDLIASGANISVHLDGLQQTRAIVSEASFAFKQTLRRLNSSTSFADQAMETTFRDPFNKRPKLPSRSHVIKKNSLASDNILSELEKKESESRRHVEAIDGHGRFKWDQIVMLQICFNKMDSLNRGLIFLSDIAQLGYDNDIHSLLRFTIFWSFVKKKQWNYFLSFFTREASSTEEPSLSLQEWIDQAEAISRERSVPLTRIRTIDQHKDIVISQHLAVNRSNRTRLFEEAFLSRKLVAGDSVWALHSNGSVWLPAVVEGVNTVDNCGESVYFYDLWYPLSNRELQQSRAMTECLQLLTLPSQQSGSLSTATLFGGTSNNLLHRYFPDLNDPSTSSTHIPHSIPIKSLRDDLALCSYAFDTIDTSGVGILSLQRLITMMMSQSYARLVSTNVALRSIFGMSLAEGNYEESLDGNYVADGLPSLLPVFIDTFSMKTVGNTSEDSFGEEEKAGSDVENLISKTDFLEFCRAIIDIKEYR